MSLRTDGEPQGGVYIGLGSNLGEPPQQLLQAIEELAGLPETSLVARSGLYRSEPLGPGDQPEYLNAVAELRTQLPAESLLEKLFEIEIRHGRRRTPRRWEARTLDLDLLLYGQAVLNTPHLQVPHPGLAQRSFVLYPLLEIAGPDLYVPGQGRLGSLCEAEPGPRIERLPGWPVGN